MRRHTGHSTAAQALENLLGSLDSAGKMRESMALAFWPRVVGPQAAAATIAEASRNGTLYIRTKSAAWSQELSLLKGRIIGELNRLSGRPVISDLRFRAEGVDPPAEISSGAFPTAEELAEVALTVEEEQRVTADLVGLDGKDNPALRRSLEVIVRRQAQLRRWRLDRGWKTCRACTALVEPGRAMCLFCSRGAMDG